MNKIKFLYRVTDSGSLVVSTVNNINIPIFSDNQIRETSKFLNIPYDDIERMRGTNLMKSGEISETDWDKFLRGIF